jgi:hypothetical protein
MYVAETRASQALCDFCTEQLSLADCSPDQFQPISTPWYLKNAEMLSCIITFCDARVACCMHCQSLPQSCLIYERLSVTPMDIRDLHFYGLSLPCETWMMYCCPIPECTT